jgi:hypothetical protein
MTVERGEGAKHVLRMARLSFWTYIWPTRLLFKTGYTDEECMTGQVTE